LVKDIYHKLLKYAMNLVDVHCHLNHDEYKGILDEVIMRAKVAGIKKIVTSGVNSPSNRAALALAEKYDIVECTLGMYPIDLLSLGPDESGMERQTEAFVLEDEFAFIKKNKDKIVGIGEVGLDYHWTKEHNEQQKKNFQQIIEFVEQIKLPIVIHSRKAELDCVEMLESSKIKKVDMHCFGGRKHLIKKGAELGFYFSIPTNIIKLQHFQTLVGIVPLGQLLTETDGPWLSPYPGKVNESAYVAESIKKIAEIKGMVAEEAANQIFKNYMDFFH